MQKKDWKSGITWRGHHYDVGEVGEKKEPNHGNCKGMKSQGGSSMGTTKTMEDESCNEGERTSSKGATEVGPNSEPQKHNKASNSNRFDALLDLDNDGNSGEIIPSQEGNKDQHEGSNNMDIMKAVQDVIEKEADKHIEKAYDSVFGISKETQSADKVEEEQEIVENTESEEENKEDEIKIGEIYWPEDEEVFYHVSGMCFDPSTKGYITWVDEESENFGALFYLPNKRGEFKLVVGGKMGAMNDMVLKDENWDRFSVCSKDFYGYKSDLLQMFMKSFGRPKSKQLTRMYSLR